MDIVYWKKLNRLPGALYDHIYTEVQYDSHSKKIVNFTVIQLIEYAEQTYEVKKHDCAHGKYHVHHYFEGPRVKATETTEPITSALYWQAKRDILENWQNYRERYIRKYLIKKDNQLVY